MLTIPEEHKVTIRALVEADPEVAQATCDIPHIDPSTYLVEGSPYRGNVLPYCGCFVGVYAWMQECKAGRTTPTHTSACDGWASNCRGNAHNPPGLI